MDPLKELKVALKTGEQKKVMGAYQKVGQACQNCHLENMIKVQQKYHWGNYEAIKVKDPLTNEEVGYKHFMEYINSSFAGICTDVEQGQIENAQKHFQAFKLRFQTLKETCWHCHDTERKCYVDENAQMMIDKLGQALSESSINSNKSRELSMGIGMENCFKCHLVHLPSAFAKFQFKF